MIIFLAMLVETAMSLAGPWPLKIVLDSVVGHHPMPHWVARLIGPEVADHKMGLAALAAALIVSSQCSARAASYVDNYYTESVGPVRRQRPAHAGLPPPRPALARLLRQAADRKPLVTITTDITTIQNFASGRRSGSSSTS